VPGDVDQELLPATDVDAPVVVLAAKVAKQEVAADEALGGELRHAVVLACHAWAANRNLAYGVGRDRPAGLVKQVDFDALQRATDRRFATGRAVMVDCHCAGLGRTVELAHRPTMVLAKPARHLFG